MAVIREGPRNPYVEVPAEVSEAFRPLARAGRITVDGTLNGVSVRGTLVPVAAGGHRLYVSGGMRAAASVGVGDTVALELTGRPPSEVEAADDLAAALDAAGARVGYDALTPSHRRELQRYIDDARSPATRAKRIEAATRHVLTPHRPAERQPIDRPLWTCPRCGNAFATRNQYHSCQRFELSEVFAGKPPQVRRLYDAVDAAIRENGPVTVVCYRDRVAFMVRVRFAGLVPRQRWVNMELWLPRRVDGPRFSRVETLYPNTHIHTLRLRDTAELDAELRGWLREAYHVGCGNEPDR
ncbi:MAG TPA: DUF1905 domain-containing protein [Pseudonocardiaceae bacterium]